MKLVTAVLGTSLLLAALAGGAGRVQAIDPLSGPCCVCTSCDFSEQCFTGLALSESARCTNLCEQVNCSAGDVQDPACETFTPLCEVITPAPAPPQPAPAMRPLALVVAALAVALVGVRRLARRRSSRVRAAQP